MRQRWEPRAYSYQARGRVNVSQNRARQKEHLERLARMDRMSAEPAEAEQEPRRAIARMLMPRRKPAQKERMPVPTDAATAAALAQQPEPAAPQPWQDSRGKSGGPTPAPPSWTSPADLAAMDQRDLAQKRLDIEKRAQRERKQYVDSINGSGLVPNQGGGQIGKPAGGPSPAYVEPRQPSISPPRPQPTPQPSLQPPMASQPSQRPQPAPQPAPQPPQWNMRPQTPGPAYTPQALPTAPLPAQSPAPEPAQMRGSLYPNNGMGRMPLDYGVEPMAMGYQNFLNPVHDEAKSGFINMISRRLR